MEGTEQIDVSCNNHFDYDYGTRSVITDRQNGYVIEQCIKLGQLLSLDEDESAHQKFFRTSF